jgi:hypothetical protein
MSYGSGMARRARARVRLLGAPSTAALARTVHRILVSRRITRRCSKQHVRERIATRMMMPRVRLHVKGQIIPLHSALHRQGKDMVYIPLIHVFFFFFFFFLFSFSKFHIYSSFINYMIICDADEDEF